MRTPSAAALAAAACLLAQAAPAGIIRVSTNSESVANDGFVSFREALLIARGDRQPFISPNPEVPDEETEVTLPVGAGVADEIQVADEVGTIALLSPLPALSDSTDFIFASSFAMIDAAAVNAGTSSALFELSTPGHRINGLTIANYGGTAIRVLAANTTVNGTQIVNCGRTALEVSGAAATGGTFSNLVIYDGRSGAVRVDQGATGNTFTSFFLFGNAGDGLRVNAANGNTFRAFGIGVRTPAESFAGAGNAGWGIRVDGGSKNNNFYNPEGEATAGYIANNSLGGMLIEGAGTEGNRIQSAFFGFSTEVAAWTGNGDGPGLEVRDGAKNNVLGAQGGNTPLLFGGHRDSALRITGPGTTGNNIRRMYFGTDGVSNTPRWNRSHAVEIADGAGSMIIADQQELSQVEIDFCDGHGLFLNGSNSSDAVKDINVGVFHFGQRKRESDDYCIGGDAVRIAGNVTGVRLGGGVDFQHPNHTCGAAGYGVRIMGPQVSGIELVKIHAGVSFNANGNALGGLFIGDGAHGITFDNSVESYFGANGGPGITIGTSSILPQDIAITRCTIGLGTFTNEGYGNAGPGVLIDSATAVALQNVAIGAEGLGNTISGNQSDGIVLRNVQGVKLLGNRIGLGIDGNTPAPNTGHGIRIDGCSNIKVGETAETRNYIAGNAMSGVLLEGASHFVTFAGNYIGLGTSGSDAGNGEHGIAILPPGPPAGQALRIGSALDSLPNIISGNGGSGIFADGRTGALERVRIHGNIIGLDSGGLIGIPNSTGITLAGAQLSDVQIGDPSVPGTGNVISGNSVAGIAIDGATQWTVVGNAIGTDQDRNDPAPNGEGIVLSNTQNGALGLANAQNGINCIAGNTGAGVRIGEGVGGPDLRIEANRIGYWGKTRLPNRDGIEVSKHSACDPPLLIGSAGRANLLGDMENRNAISGNTRDGIRILGEDAAVAGVQVWGNTIGLFEDMAAAMPNGEAGVRVAGGFAERIIVGVDPAQSRDDINVISGNTGPGVLVEDFAVDVDILQNRIGAGAADDLPRGNGEDGVLLKTGAVRAKVRENDIRYNGRNGIRAEGDQSRLNTFSRNRIHMNLKEGIRLLEGANDDIAPPFLDRRYAEGRITSVYPVHSGILAGKIEVFHDPVDGARDGYWGQGKDYIQDITADASGDALIPLSILKNGPFPTATVTDGLGNTSEFSPLADATIVQSAHSFLDLFVARKPTYVRLAMDTGKGAETRDVSARVTIGGSAGESSPPRVALRPFGWPDTRENVRKKGEHTVNCIVAEPPAGPQKVEATILQGNIERAKIDFGTRTFQEIAPFRVGLVSVASPDTNGVLRAPDPLAAVESLRFLASAYPLAPREFLRLVGNLPGLAIDAPPHEKEQRYDLAKAIDTIRIEAGDSRGVSHRYAAGFVSSLVGLSPTGSLLGNTFPAAFPSVVMLVDRASPSTPNTSTLPHEIGHTPPFSFGDTYANGKPSPNNPINPLSARHTRHGNLLVEADWLHAIGVKFAEAGFLQPGPIWSPPAAVAGTRSVHDFMGNSDYGWIDENMHKRLFAGLGGSGAGVRASRESLDGAYIVFASISSDGTAAIARVAREPESVEPMHVLDPLLPAWTAELLDAGGKVLASAQFTATAEEELLDRDGDNVNDGRYESVPRVPATVALPYHASAARVRLMQGGSEKASLSKSAQSPSVSFTSPTGGGALTSSPVVIRWDMSDGDTPAGGLSATVLYTPDGIRFLPVGVAEGLEACLVSPAQLPGGPTPRFLVRVSDGWNTAEASMATPYTAFDRMPAAAITSPEDGATVGVGESFGLEAAAFDAEDGILLDASIEWRLDGAAEPFATDASALLVLGTSGPHTLEMRATDSSGHSVSDTITLNAVPPPYDTLRTIRILLGYELSAAGDDRNADGRVDAGDFTAETAAD